MVVIVGSRSMLSCHAFDLMSARGAPLAIVVAILAAGCATGSRQPLRETTSAAADCPRDVLFRESTFARVSDVLASAQRVLARSVITSQGRMYRLTPKWAPIAFVARVSAVESRQNVGYNRLVPGSL